MRAASVLLLCLAVVACKQQAAPARESDSHKDVQMPANAQEATKAPAPVAEHEAPPRPGDVLYMIYQVDGDGASSYSIQNGSVATYWAGHEFTLGGKQYFTGFAYATSEKFNGNTKPDLSKGVSLSQSTYYLRDPGTPKPWSFVGSEHWIGDYGTTLELGPKFDSSRKILEYPIRNEVMLLAIPSLESPPLGKGQSFYSLFSFRPSKAADIEGSHWNYRGDILVGEDSAEDCKSNSNVPCVKWTGTLKFEGDGLAMPTIRVIPQGTTVDDETGEARKIDDREASVYVLRNGKYEFK